MKIINLLLKLMVVLLSLPVVALLLVEGACLVFTDTLPAAIRKLSLYLKNLNCTQTQALRKTR
jgi:hypothetical protein